MRREFTIVAQGRHTRRCLREVPVIALHELCIDLMPEPR